MILTALRYLGRGWTFDDLSESTGISEEVIRVFFHTFIEYGSTILYNQHVIAPQNTFEAKSHSYEFEVAGLPGAIGSMDATHIILEKVSFKRRQSHLGFKHTCTARTYNIVVNHRRRILGTTDGHPARWNDKSIVRFDGIAMGLRNGTLLSDDFIFELYDYDKDGNVTKVKYKGPWLLVDNGYHNWPVTIPPFKATTSLKEVRFSNWLESIRKDVECTFGILKGRWRILKSGIRLQGVEPADKIWKTCCALHNLLLDVDGLDEKWEYGVPSDWEGALGNHDDYDVVYQMTLDRLNNPEAAREYDISAMGRGSDEIDRIDEIDDNENDVDDLLTNDEVEIERNNERDNAIIVRNLSFQTFRNKLVTHFDIAYKKGEIKWPTRNRVRQIEF